MARALGFGLAGAALGAIPLVGAYTNYRGRVEVGEPLWDAPSEFSAGVAAAANVLASCLAVLTSSPAPLVVGALPGAIYYSQLGAETSASLGELVLGRNQP